MSVENISITLHKRTHLLSDLGKLSSDSLSTAELQAVQFCIDWRNGNEVFEIKTSGSTGQPKIISLRREQMKTSARMTAKAIGLKKGMTALACLDTNLVGGLMMLVRSMELGMNLIITEPLANPLSKISKDQVVDFTALVPYQLKSILSSSDASRLNDIQKILIGGGEVDAVLENSLQGYRSEFYATYGMTETISHIALRRLNGAERQKIFYALEDVQLGTDSRGCLVIKAGYLSSAPIVTNDIVELVTPNEFKWLGRADFLINSGGVKVIPEKVEGEISSLMPGGRFFVHGFPHNKLGQQVCLIIEGTPWPNDKKNILLESIKSKVSKYEVPRQILFVEKFVLAGNEKVNRRETATLVTVE